MSPIYHAAPLAQRNPRAHCTRCGKHIGFGPCTWCAKAPNPPRIPGVKA